MLIIILISIICLTMIFCLIYYIMNKHFKIYGGEFTKLKANQKYEMINNTIFSLIHLIDVNVYNKHILDINKTKIGFFKILPQKFLSDSYYFNKIINKTFKISNVLTKCEFKSKYFREFVKNNNLNSLRDKFLYPDKTTNVSNNPVYLNTRMFFVNKHYYDINFNKINVNDIKNSLYFYNINNISDVIFCHIDISLQ